MRVDIELASGDARVMRVIPAIAFGLVSTFAGCQHHDAVRIAARADAKPIDASTVADRDPRLLRVFNGISGEAVAWSDMISRLDDADVIILGEQHDDGVGHATQLAITQDVAERRGPGGALSLEMLERDEQILVDDWQEGLIDTSTFAKLTDSESWAGEGSWENWYQPIINAAHDARWRIVAANTPRRYVRLARTKGYEFLDDLPVERRSLLALPRTWPLDYRQRFIDVMSGMRDDDDESEAQTPTTAPEQRSPHGPMKPEDVDSALRSQLLWDATMADSIARARQRGTKPVIHLVGQFHSDFQGGTVQETRARLGRGATIITVSMQRRERDTLHERDQHRADFVIYTGRRPPRPKPPETQPTTQAEPLPAQPPEQPIAQSSQ